MFIQFCPSGSAGSDFISGIVSNAFSTVSEFVAPGVILVGEGSPSRVKHLLANERRRPSAGCPKCRSPRSIVGDAEGEVTLAKLQRTVMKEPKVLSPAEVTEIRRRLEAASKNSNPLPIPKGPMPNNLTSSATAESLNPSGPNGPDHQQSAARSCSPRPSRSQMTAGISRHSSRVRTMTRSRSTAPLPLAETTRTPMIRWPNEAPPSDTSAIVITANTNSVSNARSWPWPRKIKPATNIEANQSMMSASTRRPSGATDPGPAWVDLDVRRGNRTRSLFLRVWRGPCSHEATSRRSMGSNKLTVAADSASGDAGRAGGGCVACRQHTGHLGAIPPM